MAKITKLFIATTKLIFKIVLVLFLLFILGIIVLGFILNSPENAKSHDECMKRCLAQGISKEDCILSACS